MSAFAMRYRFARRLWCSTFFLVCVGCGSETSLSRAVASANSLKSEQDLKASKTLLKKALFADEHALSEKLSLWETEMSRLAEKDDFASKTMRQNLETIDLPEIFSTEQDALYLWSELHRATGCSESEWILVAALEGHAAAQHVAGTFVEGGDCGWKKDSSEARFWWTKSSTGGHEGATILLGASMLKSNEVDRGVALLAQAGEDGNLTALHTLGLYQLALPTGEQNVERAKAYFEEAAAKGHPPSQVSLGNLLSARRDTWDEGLEWLRKAAEQGDAAGQYFYAKALLMEDDGFSQAMPWFRKAAEQGHIEAKVNIGKLFWDGDFRSNTQAADCAEAARWFAEPAEMGNRYAMAQLGYAYSGACEKIEPDPAKMISLWNAAADMGSAHAMRGLGYAYKSGNGVPRNMATSRRWLRQAAAHGDEAAARTLESSEYQRQKGLEYGQNLLSGILALHLMEREASRRRAEAGGSSCRAMTSPCDLPPKGNWKRQYWCYTDFSYTGNPTYCRDQAGGVRRQGGLASRCNWATGWCGNRVE